MNSPMNVKGVAPLPTGASVETGVKDEATRDSADKGAGSGCPPPSCCASSFVVEVTPDWHHIPVDEKGRPIRNAQ